MAGTLKTNEVILQSPNGLVEKSVSMGDDGIVKIDGIKVANNNDLVLKADLSYVNTRRQIVGGYQFGSYRSGSSASQSFFASIPIPKGAKIKNITQKFVSNATSYNFTTTVQIINPLSNAIATLSTVSTTSGDTNPVHSIPLDYTLLSGEGLLLTASISASGGTYYYIYQPIVEYELA